MGGVGAPMPSWLELWNEWEIQVVVIASFSLQVILFFFAGIRRYSVSFVLKALLWLVYLLADLVAMYALGHMSSVFSKKSSGQHQLVAFWAPFLLLHLGGQDTITAYALEDNKLWLRHLLNMFVQVAGTTYVLYKYINVGEATFVRAAMLVLAAAIVKYGERIWALKLASKGSSNYNKQRWGRRLCCIHVAKVLYSIYDCLSSMAEIFSRWMEERDYFTKNKQFGTYALLVMTAHRLRQVFLKPLIIERNEASIDWNGLINEISRFPFRWEIDESKDEPSEKKRQIGKVYKLIEVELALMYDTLYTKAEVIHTWYGYCIRTVSLVSCFAALVVFRKSNRDSYSTPDTAITFALLGGACVLEMASVLKVIGSTWTYAILKGQGWDWLAWVIMFARYHLIVVKDGRWSDSVGQLNFLSFCVRSKRTSLMGAIAKWIGLNDLRDKAHCTKHAKLSPAVKEFVWGFLRGQKSPMVEIKEVDVRSGNWALRFSGFDESEQLDGSMSFEFHKCVLIWHIATDTFLNHPAVKSQLDYKDMAEAISTLSDYMVYLLVRHPDILPIKIVDADSGLFDEACASFNFGFCSVGHPSILDYNRTNQFDHHLDNISAVYNLRQLGRNARPRQVLMKACTLAQTMLRMKLNLTHKMAIIGTVWTEMLCYAATNATGGFHARQLSNGGEFLTHILLLTKYSSLIDKEPKPSEASDEDLEASAAGHIVLNVDDDSNDEITEIRPT